MSAAPPAACPLCGGTESVRYRSLWGVSGFYRPADLPGEWPPLTSCLPCFRAYKVRVSDALAAHAEEGRRREAEARADLAASSCLGCRYYRASKDRAGRPEDYGVCCRHAPIGYKDDDGDMRTYWPQVSEASMCGDREPVETGGEP